MPTSEFDLIERLGQTLKAPAITGDVVCGIGDDAAVLRQGGGTLAWTVDSAVEGVHFMLTWLSFDALGYRSFQAAASDLAAMGATPVAALSSLTVPAAADDDDVVSLAQGQQEAALELQCPVIGGNITRGEHWSVTTSLIGRCPSAMYRSGAKQDESLWLIGDVGLAHAGLQSLRLPIPNPGLALRGYIAECQLAWRRPSALCTRGSELIGRANSCIDISDGLAGDARHIALASSVKLVLEEKKLRAALPRALYKLAAAYGKDALDWALYGGEDYALLASGPEADRPAWAAPIGYVGAASSDPTDAVCLQTATGALHPLHGGFDHRLV